MADARFLLDTNICIYVLADASSKAARRVQQCEQGAVVVSAITFGELMQGVRSGSRDDELTLAAFFRHVPVLPFDMAAGEAYAALPFRHGSFDRLIAGHALSLGLTLVTDNERDFCALPGLRLENWTRP